MQIFPYIYATNGLEYLDYVDPRNVHHINYHHVLEFKFMNLVAGFDRDDILSRLSSRRGRQTSIPRVSGSPVHLASQLKGGESDKAE